MFVPLKDTEGISIRPIGTIGIIIINVAIFLEMLFYSSSSPNPVASQNAIYLRYGLIPYQITSGHIIIPSSLQPAWLTIFTSMFLHGGYMHIIGNMWFFWIFGNNVEDYFGTIRFLIFYLLGGIVAALAQIAVAPYSKTPVIGASGAIAAVMGAYFYLFPRSRIKTLAFLFFFITFIEIPAPFFLLIWILMQFSSAFMSFGAATGVAYWAHIGGFTFGLLVAIIFKSMNRRRNEFYYG